MTTFKDNFYRSSDDRPSSDEDRQSGWIAAWIFRLDAWLRRRENVFEYTDDPDCIFRIQMGHAQAAATLRDGTAVSAGDPMIVLHLWNEQIPFIAPDGPSVGWGREVRRKIGTSLIELDRYLEGCREFDDVRAISADVALGTAAQSGKIVDMARRYGFDDVGPMQGSAGIFRRLGQNILMLMLVLAANPASARPSVLRRRHRPLCLSRDLLHARAERLERKGGREGQS